MPAVPWPGSANGATSTRPGPTSTVPSSWARAIASWTGSPTGPKTCGPPGAPAGPCSCSIGPSPSRPDDWRLHAIRAEALGTLGRRADRDAEQARAVDLGADIPALMRIGEERARAGRHREAALLFDRAIATGTVPYEVWEWAALTHLAAGDEDGYRRTCAVLRSRYPDLAPGMPGRLATRPRLHARARRARPGRPGPGMGGGRPAGRLARKRGGGPVPFPPAHRRRALPVGTIPRSDRVHPPRDRRGRGPGPPRGCRVPGDGALPLGRSARRPGDAGPMPDTRATRPPASSTVSSNRPINSVARPSASSSPTRSPRTSSRPEAHPRPHPLTLDLARKEIRNPVLTSGRCLLLMVVRHLRSEVESTGRSMRDRATFGGLPRALDQPFSERYLHGPSAPPPAEAIVGSFALRPPISNSARVDGPHGPRLIGTAGPGVSSMGIRARRPSRAGFPSLESCD